MNLKFVEYAYFPTASTNAYPSSPAVLMVYIERVYSSLAKG